jgi:hypothetical protein
MNGLVEPNREKFLIMQIHQYKTLIKSNRLKKDENLPEAIL